MADNFDFTEGSGKSGAADDVSGVLFAKVKLDFGTDGVSAPALAGAGAVATGVQRITLASDDPAVVSLAIIDDWDDGDKCKVIIQTGSNAIGKLAANSGVDIGDVTINNANGASAVHIQDGGNTITIDGSLTTVSTVTNLAQMGGTAITMDEGVHDAGTQRVTLATDDDGVAHLATIAGDTTSLDGKIVVGGGAEAGAVLVTIANNSTGLVTVDTTGTSGLEVVQVTAADLNMTEASASAIKNAVEIMDDWDETNRAKVNTIAGQVGVQGAEGQITALTQRVTLATDDDAVASLGIIDDWDAVHASAASSDGPQVMGVAHSTALPTDVGADGDAARLLTDRYGRLCTGLQPQAAKAILDNADTTTAREVVGATATRRIFVTSLILSVATAGNYWLEDGDATQVTGKFYLAANGGVAITFPEGTPLNTVTQNKALNVKGSTSGNVSVTVTYYLAV